MWRSSSLRFLSRTPLCGLVKPTRCLAAGQPIRPWFLLSSGASPSPLPGGTPDIGSCRGGGGGGGETLDSMTFSEAKKLMRMVNVEGLKRRLGMEGEEVSGYRELLEACERMRWRCLGRRTSPLPVSSMKRVWSFSLETRCISTRVRNTSASAKLRVGHRCTYYATRASDVRSSHAVFNGIVHDEAQNLCRSKATMLSEQDSQVADRNPLEPSHKQRTGGNISAVDKRKFLINTLFDLKGSKEDVYGTLDAWVAWERIFPLVSLKRALLALEKEEQWHRIVQVIKWMLSKGQGTTMGTYEQLIRALEKDNRAEEAHKIWVKKISHDLHSVPWRVCDLMISIYYRNDMLERLVKLFKGLESYERKPPSKSIVRKVADAYEILGLLEDKNRVIEKYSDLFSESPKESFKNFRKVSRKNDKKQEKKKHRNSEATDNSPVDSGPSDVEMDSAV